MNDDNNRYNGSDPDYNWRIFWWSVITVALLIVSVGICYVSSFLNR